MIGYTVTTESGLRIASGSAPDDTGALGAALAAVLALPAAGPGAAQAPGLLRVRVGEAEPMLIRPAPSSGDPERDHRGMSAFLTQVYRDETNDPYAMLPPVVSTPG